MKFNRSSPKAVAVAALLTSSVIGLSLGTAFADTKSTSAQKPSGITRKQTRSSLPASTKTSSKPPARPKGATAPKGGTVPKGRKPPKSGSGKPPSGSPPSGVKGKGGARGRGSSAPPSGGPGPGSGSPAVTGTAAFTLSQGTKRSQKGWITATKQNESGVMVKSAGALELQDVNVRTSGSSSSSDDSSFYGLDAGVLTEGTVTISKSSVTTSDDGANGMFAYGTKAVIDASNVTVRASGQYAHGIMSSGGGTIDARDLNVSTQGASSAAVATDRGGGTIKVSGGIFRTSGMNSPGIYSTGSISARGATFVARGAEAAVIEGSNSVTLDNSRLTAGKNRGVMIYQSFSGDAQGQSGVFTMSGGRLSTTSGPLFYVTNTSALIN